MALFYYTASTHSNACFFCYPSSSNSALFLNFSFILHFNFCRCCCRCPHPSRCLSVHCGYFMFYVSFIWLVYTQLASLKILISFLFFLCYFFLFYVHLLCVRLFIILMLSRITFGHCHLNVNILYFMFVHSFGFLWFLLQCLQPVHKSSAFIEQRQTHKHTSA